MLTNDMTRLSGEIRGLRGQRAALISDLQNGARELKKNVTDLRAHFHRARTTMAKRTRNERLTTVNNRRRDMRNDLAGVRRAWAGKS